MQHHILIVDDEPQIRNLLAEFLTRCGYRVTPVPSASEAGAVVQADRPDLIITDLQLEDSDGLDMIAKLRATLPDTPVILLTGVLFDPKVARDVLSKKVSSYLAKTAPLGRILEEVKRLLPK